ncbi:EscU/YscU/HrcU family type III secretion system export apparatus switch protein [Leifsonia sp. Leaf264]|uniref:EscU/YscU/HrcU family type III secretion system export apparatus switch protein n=1 Tax=Leifsonia sp. Leaf264 TaxID=1736314 RepID=UPI0006F440F6|nr:EscU/YscU/HrcU family type III secretion system export apparatus switch protein [Leifsonia sp. Leaf264]KQO98249.1 type III secretion protein [Leifsonia sp. Leaf264]
MSDSGEKTEQATEKRMKEVREKGKLQKSQDVAAWVGVGAAAAVLPTVISAGTNAATIQLHTALDTIAHPDPTIAVKALEDGLMSILPTIAIMLAVVAVAIIVSTVAQGGLHLKKFEMKVEQFNIVSGIKRSFGTQALWQGVKALLKTAVIGYVLYSVIQGLMPVLTQAGGMSVASLLVSASSGVTGLLTSAVVAGLIVAAADVFVVMKKNRKQTRMTKKEVTDEHKNTDGDPLIKSQRRSRQLAMSRNRMISDVATADVVLVNPTHVAIALKYQQGVSAPRMVAKGKGVIAARIRDEAEKKGVPMVKDIPLTRALHDACKIGQEIPTSYYGAIATVLAFVASLKRQGKAAGVHQMSKPIPVPTTAS